MDFSRTTQPQTVAPGISATPAAGNNNNKRRSGGANWVMIGNLAFVGVVTLLLIFLIWFAKSPANNTENKFVDSTKLQAVFLNTGQVYFGKVKSMTDKYFVVTNIYYLQTANAGSGAAASAANSSVSLVKLGCELHEPFDQMVINRSQITFWENLQDNGQVAKAVATFQKQNPSGQKCADQSSSSGSTTNSVQSAGNSPSGSTTPATTPKP